MLAHDLPSHSYLHIPDLFPPLSFPPPYSIYTFSGMSFSTMFLSLHRRERPLIFKNKRTTSDSTERVICQT